MKVNAPLPLIPALAMPAASIAFAFPAFPTASHADAAGHNQKSEKATNAECETSPATARELPAGLNQADGNAVDGDSSTMTPSTNSYHISPGAASARVKKGCNRSVLPVGSNFMPIPLNNQDIVQTFKEYCKMNKIKNTHTRQGRAAQYWFLAGVRTVNGGTLSPYLEIIHQSGRSLLDEKGNA